MLGLLGRIARGPTTDAALADVWHSPCDLRRPLLSVECRHTAYIPKQTGSRLSHPLAALIRGQADRAALAATTQT
jgi:hypothetical protein